MTDQSTYETLRHFADSWGLLAMMVLFVVLNAWAFRPGAKRHNQRAATMIFDDAAEPAKKDQDHG